MIQQCRRDHQVPEYITVVLLFRMMPRGTCILENFLCGRWQIQDFRDKRINKLIKSSPKESERKQRCVER